MAPPWRRRWGRPATTCSTIDVTRDPADLLARLTPRPNVVFNALHGRWGEDGTIQGLLDLLAVPYTHSGLLASALAMHKPTAKLVFERAGIPVAEHVVVGREALAAGEPMPRPYVIKPLNEGSSVGVRIVRNGDNLSPSAGDWAFGDTVMIERFIPGREFTVAVMGGRPLAVTEITTARGFYDYDAKYAPGGSRHVVPAQVEPAVYAEAMALVGAGASGARLSGRLARRSPLRRPAALHARGEYPAGHDADVAGPRTGGVRRHQLPRPGRLDGRERGVRRVTTRRSFSRGKRGGQPRLRVVPVWRTRPATAVLSATFVAALLGAAWLVWQAGMPQRAAASAVRSLVGVSADAGFVVRDIFVVGRDSTPKATLLQALAVGYGTPILAVDLEAARARVQALPWVRQASVRRVLPDTIVVEIVERRPLALWQHDKKFALIDEEGQTILRDDVARFGGLMVVVGEDAAANATALVRMLATEPDLMRRVKAAVRVGGRRWNVHLAQGIDVELPEQDPEAAWRRLADYQRRYGVLDKPVRTIDLRLSDRLTVLPAPPKTTGKADGDA